MIAKKQYDSILYASAVHGRSAEERGPDEPPAWKVWNGFD